MGLRNGCRKSASVLNVAVRKVKILSCRVDTASVTSLVSFLELDEETVSGAGWLLGTTEFTRWWWLQKRR